MKVRSVVAAIDNQDSKDRLSGLKVVADLDGNGEYDALDRLLGSQEIGSKGGAVNIEFDEAIALGVLDHLDLLLVADFGESEGDGRNNQGAVGALIPWGGVGFGVALGLLVLGAACVPRRRRSLVWASAGASAALGLTLSAACHSGQEGSVDAYRVSVLKVIATETATGHYGNVQGVEDAISPVILIKD